MEHTSARADTGLFLVRETHYLDSLDTSHLQVVRQHDGKFCNEHGISVEPESCVQPLLSLTIWRC